MSSQYKKRHIGENKLDSENRYDDDKRRNEVQRIEKRNIRMTKRPKRSIRRNT